MATIETRPISQNEKDEIIKLSRMLIDTYESKDTDYYTLILDNFKYGINERIIDFKSIAYNKETAGYYHLGKKDDNTLEIYFLFVMEEYRKQGIGSYIIADAIQYAYRLKRKLYIEVSKKNTYAIKFLTNFGFEKTEVSGNNKNHLIAFTCDPYNLYSSQSKHHY